MKPITGKTVGKILKEAGTAPSMPEDLDNLIKKAIRLRRHLERSKGDLYDKRFLQLVESKVRRLAKYYRKEGILPKDWKYHVEGSA